jgi:orotidine-5'-phosphate decarboxylase
MSRASELGKGVIVLAATSNPEGASLQQAQNNNDESIALSIWKSLSEVNALTAGAGDRLGSFGAVIGATLSLNKFGLQSVSADSQKVATPILAPGFGAQGARLLDAGRLFGSASSQLIASVSRSVIATPNVSDAIEQAKTELAEGLA